MIGRHLKKDQMLFQSEGIIYIDESKNCTLLWMTCTLLGKNKQTNKTNQQIYYNPEQFH